MEILMMCWRVGMSNGDMDDVLEGWDIKWIYG